MPRRSKLELLLQVFGMWLLVQTLLKFVGLIITTLLVAAIGLMAATLFGLRFRRPQLGRLYGHPAGRIWIDFVCRCVGQQPPQDLAAQEATPELQLRTPQDFAWCASRLKKRVFGHDRAVDAMLHQLEQAVQLRGRSLGGANQPPIGVFTLIGAPGIGKRTLATRLGELLLRGCPTTVINLSDFSDDQAAARLLGTAGQEGCLLQAVRRYPCHTLVLENFEDAHPQVVAALRHVIADGQSAGMNGGGIVGFGNCLIVFTSTAGTDQELLSALDRDAIVERVIAAASCVPSLMSLSSECLGLDAPDDETKARVVLQVMLDECRKYRVVLDYVEPEVVVQEIARFSPASGFEPVKLRIARWIRGPVHLAASQGLESLVLTRDLILPPQPQLHQQPLQGVA